MIRSPSRLGAALTTWFVLMIGTALLAALWATFGTSTRRFDPVATSVVTDRDLDPIGWIGGFVIVVAAFAGIVTAWRRVVLIDGTGITRRRLRGTDFVAWEDVSGARLSVRNASWGLQVEHEGGRFGLRLPDRRRAETAATIERWLGDAKHIGPGRDRVELELPQIDDEAPIQERQSAHDLGVALGRAPVTSPRPRWTRRDLWKILPALAVTLTAGGIRIWNTAHRDDERPPPPTIDLGVLSGLGEPDVATIDIGARAIAERALATLTGASSSIDCDGRIPTGGGLAGVRYVSVRTADGLWESTPAKAPPTTSTTWRLDDLVTSGVFATTGPLPEPSERWEIKVNTYLGPAWFGCKPADGPAP